MGCQRPFLSRPFFKTRDEVYINQNEAAARLVETPLHINLHGALRNYSQFAHWPTNVRNTLSILISSDIGKANVRTVCKDKHLLCNSDVKMYVLVTNDNID